MADPEVIVAPAAEAVVADPAPATDPTPAVVADPAPAPEPTTVETIEDSQGMGGYWFLRRIEEFHENEKGFIVRFPLPFLWYGRVYDACTNTVWVGVYFFDGVIRIVTGGPFFTLMFGVFKTLVSPKYAKKAESLNLYRRPVKNV